MANPTQGAFDQVYDAAQVRLGQLYAAMLKARRELLPYRQFRDAILDLAQGMEYAALTGDATELNIILGRLVQDYALGAVYTDPLLRPMLPPIPLAPSAVRAFVLGMGTGNQVLGMGEGNQVLGVRVELVPASLPVPIIA